jgi:hypothetical protein
MEGGGRQSLREGKVRRGWVVVVVVSILLKFHLMNVQ